MTITIKTNYAEITLNDNSDRSMIGGDCYTEATIKLVEKVAEKVKELSKIE